MILLTSDQQPDCQNYIQPPALLQPIQQATLRQNMKMIKRSFSLNRKQEPHEPRAALSQTDYYLIECQASGFCLREELRTFKLQEGDHVQVMGGELAEHDPSLLSFLWMFKYNKEEDLHRIVHVRTDLSLTSDQFECELAHGSLEEEQAFQINQIKNGLYRIRDHNDNFLSLDGILQPNDYAERDPSQEFSLRRLPAEEVPALIGTGFICSRDSKMAMDLTNSSRLNENEIVLHPLSYRMNQRWVFEGIDPEKEEGLGQIRDSIDRSRPSNALRVYIRSALTEQFVSFNREHKQLMQSSYPEEWRLEPRRTGFMQEEHPEFCIEHVKQHKYLSCRESSFELYLSSEPTPWLIPDPFLSLQHAVNKESQQEGRRTTI